VSAGPRHVTLVLLLGVSGVAAQEGSAEWSLRMPSSELVAYRGVASYDAAGSGPGAMMYPGGAGVAGLLVGILTHAAIVESGKAAEKTRIQAQADQVLQPFREQLAEFRYPQLLQMALRPLSAGPKLLPPGTEAGWVISSLPVFSMTADRQALVLDNEVALFRPGASAKPMYSGTVRVVSAPRGTVDPVAEWSAPAEGTTLLKQESARMVAHSIQLALRDALHPTPNAGGAHRTIRYRQGDEDKMERAQPLETLCQRIVMRNLRGWLMSVPVRPEGAGSAAPCVASGWR
jgi:hypothetical protein